MPGIKRCRKISPSSELHALKLTQTTITKRKHVSFVCTEHTEDTPFVCTEHTEDTPQAIVVEKTGVQHPSYVHTRGSWHSADSLPLVLLVMT